ncbi:MAG: transglutaminase family protein [Gammaproteobacteria bacterium]
MSIQVAIRHTTEYRFDRPVGLSPHVLRVRPAPHTRTNIAAYSLKVEPGGYFLNWQQDPYSNYLARLVFPERARYLKVDVEVIADMVAINPFDYFLDEEAVDFPFRYEPEVQEDLAPYLVVEEYGDALGEWVASVPREKMPTNDFLVALNQRLERDVDYIVRFEPGVQSCEETLRSGRGSCRDSAWLLVQILRRLGLASRFVSGYLVQLTEDVKALDGPAGPDADFSDLHAWTEVYLPGAGWVGLDPTSGLFAAEGHIPLAAAPHYAHAAAIEGATEPCEVEFSYSNTVTRIHEDPRVTLPYDDAAWSAIDALGQRVDRDLEARDVRLTMGGEPTFVSIDDFESPQWTTAADGPEKRAAAEDLLARLKRHYAPGGVVHRGMGKWYPGEPLPRWALNVYWRTDGEVLWADPALLANLHGPQPPAPAGVEEVFARRLAARLELDDEYVNAAFEDIYYYLWKEGTLPVDVDPRDARLNDPVERARLRRLFDGGLGRAAGYVLPLARGLDGGWRSGAWPLQRGHLFLIPGDSPLGLRLPITALPAAGVEDHDAHPADPFAPPQPLLPRHWYVNAPAQPRRIDRTGTPRGLPPDAIVRTALATEIRDGRLHVFLPPVTHADDYVELVHAVEATAAELGQSVVVEGYEPPHDPRLKLLQITPDPGVIEVNVHPAASWEELTETTTTLYGEARKSRLATEKFMLDGRHTGTGGGNHVTLGGPTPADSPMLRRPDLLRSLIAYWQNHPSLSYLFSGLFIGPTSQAPRADEARDDRLHEMETALAQIPDPGTDVPPWLVDRVLRNQLTDLTGNTHRAEFCIDKLYSPDTAGGRRGLVEFRAFEMPPHPQMSLTQMLLMRALVANFWDRPYDRPLIRWGTELHDRFMLPWFVWNDFTDVIDDLNRAGYPFDASWYDTFFEFRFPRFGAIQHRGMELTLRTALEPWHVLGEEQTASGTARYVDSSLERLQVEVTGFVPERYAVTCNGYAVPLQPTGTRGNFVGGVRFKAWDPPSGMHPTIAAHGPLTFDLVDRYNEHSVGGCRYHVAHPGGRSHDTYPVNAREAEARRLARFESFGHRQGRFVPGAVTPSRDMPFTLDLRKVEGM